LKEKDSKECLCSLLAARIDGLTGFAHRADDLIAEENDVVQLALKRLPANEAYDRVFRLRRAFQVLVNRVERNWGSS